ncbi:alpha/beta fold hydrolase [Sphingobium phenoxybenzoativorans]|uniref:Alpha/beta fold hydrolase n=1 Tax=Sphingobium phenoxybenzoativorans TaxID=1592790 RepID=A0A975KB41_9SPHN|nr:alpha/beta fold hydrolase [Sphingobium phenoxybenzoativorans]
MFLPGLLCDATLWRSQIDGLADIIAPSIADLTLDSSVEDMAARALAAAPPVFSLVALSMGGYVAFEIMRQAPERVSRLALLATGAAADDEQRTAARRRGVESLKLGRFMGVTVRMLPQLIHPSRVESELGETVMAMAQRVGGEAFLRQQEAIANRPDSRPTLHDITVPVMVCVGDSDVLTPLPASREIHAGIAGSSLHIFKDCGHLPAMERPDEVNALLRAWLRVEMPR